MSQPTRTIHILIEGRVQGVGFRAFVDLAARGHGLEGWVRNRRDGAVEAVLAGPAADVDAVLEQCRAGPPGGRVDRLEVIGEGVGVFAGFEIRRTV